MRNGWMRVFAVLWATFPASPVRAGDPVPSTPARSAVDLDAVIVTARHRAETARDVPMAVTALDADELESRGARDITALGMATPNLVIHPGRLFNATVIAYIRGIGQFDSIWGVEPGVGIYLDDVHLARPQGALLDILDVERVEVLRGPQGTLYGRNTLAGAIKYVTRPPSAEHGGRFAATFGDYGRRDEKAVLNLPLGNLRTRVALAKYDRGGYGLNLATGKGASARDAGVARVNATWNSPGDVEVRFAYDRYRDRSGPPSARRLAVAPVRIDPDQTPLDPGRYDVRSDAPEKLDLDNEGISATVDWVAGAGWRMRSTTALRRGESDSVLDMDSLPRPLWMLTRFFSERQASQEFRLRRDGGGASLVTGVYLFDGRESGSGHNVTTLFGVTPYSAADGTVRTRSAAVYANWVRDLAARWQLDAGLRYTVERRTATARNGFYTDATYATPTPLPPYFGRLSADFTESETYRAPTPSLALTWRPGEGSMVYAKASRGFKGGSYNVRANTVTAPHSAHPIDAETVVAAELGARSEWLDGRLLVDATVFHNDYRDIQLSVTTLTGQGEVFPDFRNAGSGTAKGAELEWRARVGRTLSWAGHIGYLDARYDRYIDRGADVASSRDFPNAPEWTAGTSLVAEFPLAAGTLMARVDGRYQSEVRPTTDMTPLLRQPGYALWNASLSWASPGRRWEVALHGDNLGDIRYLTSGFTYPFGITTGYYGPPRTYSLTLAYAW